MTLNASVLVHTSLLGGLSEEESEPSLVCFVGRGWLRPGEKPGLCVRARATGVAHFEVCLLPGNRLSAAVSGSDPELLGFRLFVCFC